MQNRRIIYGSLGVGILVGIVCLVVLFYGIFFNVTKVTFLDIGQGDSILISQGNNQILIDGGPDGTVLLEKLGAAMPFWDRQIEVVVATHPDQDHIDGLVDVLRTYQVSQFWQAKNTKDTSVFQAIQKELENNPETEVRNIFAGAKVNFPEGGELAVIHPFDKELVTGSEDDANLASIVMTFKIKDEVFYLGGDLPSESEDRLSVSEEITILKAAHHGSNTSTSEYFLNKTLPKDVIISAGENNRYNHPHEEVMQRIENISAKIFRTDKNGDIIYECRDNGCEVVLER